MSNILTTKVKRSREPVRACPQKQSAMFLNAFPCFSQDTVTEVMKRNLFSMPLPNEWRFGDSNNGSTRRLNWKKFKRSDNEGTDWHKLVGLCDVVERDRRYVIFVIEGSKDALAAFEFAHRAGVLRDVGVVAALGSGYRPINSELKRLAGRRLIVIGDRDHVGVESVRRVSSALCSIGVDHVALNWNSFPDADGKDLFDLLQSSNGKNPHWYCKFFSFFSPFLSVPQSSQSSLFSLFSLFSPKPFICTASGQRNRKLFDLARATKQFGVHQRKLTHSEPAQILDAWYAASAPFIEMGRDECLIHFLRVRDKVRSVPANIKEAMERARSEPLPDIGIECVPLHKIAVVCCELQRVQLGHPFFLSVRKAQAFAGLTSVSAAYDALQTLESMEVIKCVKRGIAGNPGNPATRWRYLFPM